MASRPRDRRRHHRRAHGRRRPSTGAPVAFAYREFPQHFPRPGWVEHDADEIWARGARHARRGGRRARRRRPVAGDRHHQPARDGRRVGPRDRPTPCTARSCGRTGAPRRAATSCAPPATSRSSAPAPASCSTRTSRRPSSSGCSREGGVDRRRRPRVRHRRLVDPVEPHRRRRRRARDRAVEREPHDAVRHRHAATWSDELLDLFGVPRSCLPDGAPEQRALRHDRARRAPRASRVPVSGIAGDQQAALFGQACFTPGMTKNTYGTGSFVLVNLGDVAPAAGRRPAHHGGVDARRRRSTYALEGSIFVTGAAIQWLRDGLGIIDDVVGGRTARRERARHRRRRVRARVHRARLAVLGPVRARRDRSGSPAAPRAHLVRAVGRGDGVADRRRGRRDRRRRRHRRSPSCASTAARARWTCCASSRPTCSASPCGGRSCSETTALGAAFLAGIAEGVWASPADAARAWREDAAFLPAPLPRAARAAGRVAPRRRPRPQLGRSRRLMKRALDRMRPRTPTFGDGGAGGQRGSATVAPRSSSTSRTIWYPASLTWAGSRTMVSRSRSRMSSGSSAQPTR